ncbi:transcription elongation factor [Autumnicola musiva]|uniref:Transcription elongation factor n=1 Tax=Autumnicola musiva TaxID=3075589 RepID=A0ABU3D4A6_9FLAO|nr:transcription elongation factor [Zunongwangia sp. F117]MDT0676363.1 transcription elongation factor [Zunongwangia sp. F117]
MNKIKQELYESCDQYLEDRMQRIRAAMNDLENDLENETKSSAGDKYETGREMINLEWNKLSGQLQQFKMLKETLKNVKRRNASDEIQLGSLVKTNMANYFIAIPAGQIKVAGETYFSIGVGSPIAQLLLHKKAGEDFRFNGKINQIISVE